MVVLDQLIMDQLIFKFPFTRKYYEQDYYVSKNNFTAYRLIESWPNWPGKWLNIFGEKGSGKTHLSKILEKKIQISLLFLWVTSTLFIFWQN